MMNNEKNPVGAFRKGYDAGTTGDGPNPYPSGTHEAERWETGYGLARASAELQKENRNV
jgi:hypothetical protein